jgi:hypothetical protein
MVSKNPNDDSAARLVLVKEQVHLGRDVTDRTFDVPNALACTTSVYRKW